MAGKFEVYTDKAGKFRFRLKASNGQVVATGEAYDTKAAAKNGCEAVQRAADGAEIVETDARPPPRSFGSRRIEAGSAPTNEEAARVSSSRAAFHVQ